MCTRITGHHVTEDGQIAHSSDECLLCRQWPTFDKGLLDVHLCTVVNRACHKDPSKHVPLIRSPVRTTVLTRPSKPLKRVADGKSELRQTDCLWSVYQKSGHQTSCTQPVIWHFQQGTLLSERLKHVANVYILSAWLAIVLVQLLARCNERKMMKR